MSPQSVERGPSQAVINKGILIVAGSLMLLLVVTQVYFRNFSPEAKAAHRFIREMPVAEIREISLEPYTVSSLTDHRILIHERGKIEQLATVLRGAQPFSPSHPLSNWIVMLRVVTDHGDYGGQVDFTNNGQGCFIWYNSEVMGGLNYGAYRQDALCPLLEKFAKAPPEH